MKKIKALQEENQVLIEKYDLEFKTNQVMVSCFEHKIRLLETSLSIKDKQIRNLILDNLFLKIKLAKIE